MKYVKQFLWILLFSFAGELLKYFLPFSIPASVYGFVLLFAAMETGLVKIEAVRETARFLIEIMPLLFIPAGAGLIHSWGEIRTMLVPVIVITVLSTVAVMGISGRVTQFVKRRSEGSPASASK